MIHFVYEWPRCRVPPSFEPKRPVDWWPADSVQIGRLFAAEPARMRSLLEMQAQGYAGLLCEIDGRWAAYAWMKRPRSPGPTHLTREMRRLPHYWITFCRSRPDLQGQGIYRAAIARLVGIALAEDPAARVFIDTARSNVPSQHAIAAAGFAPAGAVRTLCFLGVNRVVWGSWRVDSRQV